LGVKPGGKRGEHLQNSFGGGEEDWKKSGMDRTFLLGNFSKKKEDGRWRRQQTRDGKGDWLCY